MSRLLAPAVALVLAIAVAAPASAAFPGTDGPVYFERQTAGAVNIYSVPASGGTPVAVTTSGNAGEPAIAPDGSTLLSTEVVSGGSQIFLTDPRGLHTQLTSGQPALTAAWAPNGQTLAYAQFDGSDIEIFSMAEPGATPIQLTNLPGDDIGPAFSPDGQTIAFTRQSGEGQIWLMSASGANARALTNGTEPSWSPDGSKIVFTAEDPDSAIDSIWMIEPDGSDLTQITDDGTIDSDPAFSPSGEQIVYTSSGGPPNQQNPVGLVVIDDDGSDPTQLTSPPADTSDVDADWAVAPSNQSCGGKTVTEVGSDGADVLVGTSGRDVIAGLGGDDTIRALAGRDLVCGGAGDDELRTGAGRDLLAGGSGDDLLAAGGYRHRLRGGSGDDRLRGGHERDRCTQGSGVGPRRGCER